MAVLIILEAAIKLSIKVVPGSSRSGVEGWLGQSLKVRVGAPAEHGKANVAAEKVIADAMHMPPQSVRVVKGYSSPRKVVEISGLSESEARRRLAWLVI